MMFPCPKCNGTRTYFLMPLGQQLKCMECESTWAFVFLIFFEQWKNRSRETMPRESYIMRTPEKMAEIIAAIDPFQTEGGAQ